MNDLGEFISRESISVGKKIKLVSYFPNLIETDSRTICNGSVFVAIKGDSFDGSKFVGESLAKGAIACVVPESGMDFVSEDQLDCCIIVEDSILFLQNLARFWRQNNQFKIIGITGSNGKTTSKELIKHFLQSVGRVAATEGNFNNEIGVALTICRIKSEDQFAIVEMGARHRGNIAFLVGLADPDIGILLNIGSAHVGEFGSKQALRETKQELFTSSRPEMVAICQESDRQTKVVAERKHPRTLTVGESEDATIRIVDISPHQMGFKISLFYSGNQITVDFPYFHKSLPEHIGFVMAIAASLKLETDFSSFSWSRYKAFPGRFKAIKGKKALVFDDSYNANPESMEAGIESVLFVSHEKDCTFVLGDMLELGDTEVSEHERVGKLMKSKNVKQLITVGKLAKSIGDAACDGGPMKYHHFDDVDELMESCEDIDFSPVVYIKGSRSVGLDSLVKRLI
ncbi:MAG: UDP-N-acetylmuramoyl-tripeptide--D-alanyl-D-alanine ligase [Pseudobacteriovorax sp.]|nr:UDP-N-acetylmuramoyl-tripeptide--D-alanyl-D-alanine ligase [Pseudobacteriovorax sp.]